MSIIAKCRLFPLKMTSFNFYHLKPIFNNIKSVLYVFQYYNVKNSLGNDINCSFFV